MTDIQHLAGDPASVYSRAVVSHGIVAATTVPQLPGGEFDLSTFEAQARVSLDNLKSALEEVGSSLGHILHLTIYLTDQADRAEFDTIYREYFTPPFPRASRDRGSGASAPRP